MLLMLLLSPIQWHLLAREESAHGEDPEDVEDGGPDDRADAQVGTRDERPHNVREELGRAAFVGFDVGDFVAKNAMVGLAKGSQGERVGRGPVENEKDFALGFEDLANQVGRIFGPAVVAVAQRVARIGFSQSRPGLRTNPGIIVAGKLAARVDRIFHA